ncbi:MAG TPA: GNAT family N-acetyltransferase [Actinomycetota bacterium]
MTQVEDALRLHRLPERGRYDRETIDTILDDALICHVGFLSNDQPFVIPTIHARHGDVVYVHGSQASRMLRTLGQGIKVCLTATVVDGLVLARSVFEHSMNYRSVVVLGVAREVEGDEKVTALRAVAEHILPGRWDDVRQPNEKELRATSVLRLSLDRASAKVRTGGPKDKEEDLGLPVWAGQVPLRVVALEPLPDEITGAMDLPGYISAWLAERAALRPVGQGGGPSRSPDAPSAARSAAVVLEDLRPEHWGDVARIFRQGIATKNATFETDAPSWEDWNRTHLQAHRFLARDEETGRALGWAAAAAVSDRCVYGGVVEESVYIDESARGQGVGTQLLERLIDSTEAAGIWTIQAGIFPENQASIRLHERAGFRYVGTREAVGKMDGVWLDVLLFERRSDRVR